MSASLERKKAVFRKQRLVRELFGRRGSELIGRCFQACQGLERHSVSESDHYWELAEELIEEYGKAAELFVVRKGEDSSCPKKDRAISTGVRAGKKRQTRRD